MWFIFSTPVFISYMWQLKTVVFPHWCLLHAVLLVMKDHIFEKEKHFGHSHQLKSFIRQVPGNSRMGNYGAWLWRYNIQQNDIQHNST